MRNRYKRDINRLVDHPRRKAASRSLRSPGALNSVFSVAKGLSRQPPLLPDLPVFLLENGTTVVEMEPDFSAEKRSIGYIASDVASIAVCQDQVGYVIFTYADVSRFGIMGGPLISYSKANDQLEVTQVSANADGFRVLQNDSSPSGLPWVNVLAFDSDGTAAGQLNLDTSDLDPDTFTGQNFVVDKDSIYYLLSGYSDGPLLSDIYHFTCDIVTGQRQALYSLAGKAYPAGCANHKYHFLRVNAGTGSPRQIFVFDAAGYNLVSTFDLQDVNGFYPSICASFNRFYAFKRLPQDPGGGIYYYRTVVEIYTLSSDGTATFEQEVDLHAQFGIETVYSSAVDSALLFA